MADEPKGRARGGPAAGSLLGWGRGAALFVLHGGEVGRLYPIVRGEFVVGRGPKVDLVLDPKGVSRRHALLTRESDGGVLIRDLGSAGGTRVNDQRIDDDYALRHGDVVEVGRAILKFLEGGDLGQLYHEEIYRLTTTDALTQVANRRYFLEQLEREMSRCRRYGRSLAVALFDVDRLEGLNDRLGEVAGDLLLRQLAALLRGQVRREDVFARLSGGEFALALPETALPQAQQTAEKLRRLVERSGFDVAGEAASITLSVGIAEYRGKSSAPEELLHRAEEKLREAKRTGRNKVRA